MIVAKASRGRMIIAYLCPQENMMASESAEEPYHRLLSMSPTLSAYVIKRQCRRLQLGWACPESLVPKNWVNTYTNPVSIPTC